MGAESRGKAGSWLSVRETWTKGRSGQWARYRRRHVGRLSAVLSRRLERGDTEVGAGCHPGGLGPVLPVSSGHRAGLRVGRPSRQRDSQGHSRLEGLDGRWVGKTRAAG